MGCRASSMVALSYSVMCRIIVILLFWGSLASAQAPYFNIQFNYNNWWETTGNSTVESDSFYLAPSSFGTPWINVFDSAFVLKINKHTGNILLIKIGFFEGQSANNIIRTNKSGTYLLQGRKHPGHAGGTVDTEIYMCEMTESGLDTNTLKTFDLPGQNDNFYRPILTSDGGFACSGWSFPIEPPQYQSLLVFKCDSNLNQQYFKLLPPNPSSNHFGLGMVETPDKGFIIVGNRRVTSYNDNALIIKVDSAGNQVWWKEYEMQGYEEGLYIHDIKEVELGKYLCVGKKHIAPPLAGQDEKYWVIEIDAFGNILWSKEYNLNDRCSWRALALAHDGNYYASGYERDNVTFGNNGETYYRQYGVISKITPGGELLWHRRYTVEQLNKHYDVFFNVMATSDGGILCNGTTYENDTSHQNAWIVKLDSLGCLTPNCGPSVDVIELPVGRNSPLKIWPNPTSGEVIVEARDGQRIERLRVFDAQGREVLVQANLSAPQVSFSLSGQPDGMYFCSAMVGGVLVVRQVVKIK